ncbi:MAG TPA: RHS repeat-associated core domain-containing protein [Rhodanobacteraceae bacterium]|nr:RHS repeat-associated core domain-containing protein [Rhodanobacteraceae bacterium]
MRGGGVYSVHADQTGRPLELTAPLTGTVLWQAQGLPWVSNVTLDNWGGFYFQFPGQYKAPGDGAIHNGFRDYNAFLGRYVESDPIGLAGGVNTYVYAGNNPISNVDPLGLCPTCTELQGEAARLSASLSSLSKNTGYLAIGGLLATAVSGLAEAPSLGADTPVTVTAASVTGFFGDASLVTGSAASVLSSFANGNTSGLADFDFNRLTEFGIANELARLPGVGKYAAAISTLAGQAMDIASETPIACLKQ